MEICINLYQASFSITCLATGSPARSTKTQFSCARGILLILQKLNFLVERAGEPVLEKLNFLVQQASCPFLKTQFSCGTSILPVLEKLNFLVEPASCPFLRLVQPMATINLADRQNTPDTTDISECNDFHPISPTPYYLT
ncbi:hypothetical protein Osc7112_3923 [Oscillatoria nigro-viridis PCC 7112]|uniref:Uncharacterized protein n=1 Tax=Phormidium nigroviride PCC 7112 TaxID=179408 RepID=K9VLZ4_9CYAN|nr:hypothetical protein Osc7112_3923 [Oscillatoria nigro-viridis PCC 7112]